MIVTTVRIADVRADDCTQSRARFNDDALADYEAAYRRGDKIPPPVVFHDGEDYWLADGFHRLDAMKRTKRKTAEFQIMRGGREDAIWYACSANQANGIRRTNEDKRKAVTMALQLRPDSSNRAIADHCGVSDPFVASIRPVVLTVSTHQRTGRDGKQQQSDPEKKAKGGKASAEKRKPAPAAPAPDPFDSDAGRTHCEEEKPTPTVPVVAPIAKQPTSMAYERALADCSALSGREWAELKKEVDAIRGIA